MGKVKDEPERPATSDFIMWLLLWEFSDTIVIFLKEKVIFAVSPRKAKLLEAMKQDAAIDFKGPTLEIITRDMKAEPIPEFVKKVLAEVPETVTKFGYFKNDKVDGDLSQNVQESLEGERKATLVEMSDFIEQVSMVKIECEQSNMNIAGKFTEWTFKKIADEVENIIEDDTKVKHSQIQNKIERLIETDAISKFSKQHPGTSDDFFEYPLPIMVQSGSNMTIHKFQTDSNADLLNYRGVYINVCGKYCDMNAMASRTLLVDPKQEQKEAYMVAHDA
jgi:nucleosome binding factor SPN SPT16 subunit